MPALESATGPAAAVGGRRDPPDLRMPMLAAAAWSASLVAALAGWWGAGLAALVAAGGATMLARRGGRAGALTGAGLLLVVLAATGAAVLRADAVTTGPVADLAREGAVVGIEGVVTSDPRSFEGGYADGVALRLEVRRVTGRGSTLELSAPVLVLGGTEWEAIPLGSHVRTSGRLAAADDDQIAALLIARGEPAVLEAPDVWWRAAAAVRASLRDSVAHRPDDQRVLVPAMVNGDDEGLDPGVADDFRTTGLTHLLAVSGTNLTLVVGTLLVLARWCRVRGRWLMVVGALGIAGFVLVARTEPSVVRAAAMGTVALVGMGSGGRAGGFRALGVAVVGLLLVQPGLATSVGFALSAVATAGILVLAPSWRDALATWLPRWLAEAIAVPAAAQVACTPLVAAVSGRVSLVAVGANLLVAPVVGPATVLGLCGGLVGLMVPPLGRLLGTLASWCVAWIIAVAHRGADLPTADVGWGTGPIALVAVTVLCLVLALVAPGLLRRRAVALPAALLLTVAIAVRPPSLGWPPAGWVMVACDVGQGDALVLRSAPGAAVVVDAGPDPAAVARCLDDLGVETVPLVVLTHFHADHVDGITGVLEGREVGSVETSSLLDPPGGVAEVRAAVTAVGVPLTTAPVGITRTVGEVTLQVLWPRSSEPVAGPGDGSTANDASVVLLAEVGGVSVLLTADLEPSGQASLAAALPGLSVDVLKVPHHGSPYQDVDWLTSLDADAALVSVGEGNDYGHPSLELLDQLTRAGTAVHRTDLDGDVAIVPTDGGDSPPEVVDRE